MTDAAPTAAPNRRGFPLGPVAPLAVLVVGTLLFLLFVTPGPFRPADRRIFANDEGPLTAGDATAVGAQREPGQAVTFGHVVLFNRDHSPAVLERVRFEPGLPKGLRLLDIQVASDPNRKLVTISVGNGYPPPDVEDIGSLASFDGAEVPPDNTPQGERGVALVMGFRFEESGVASFREVHVDYRIGRSKYRAELAKTFIVCGPAADFPDGCPDSDEVYPED